MKLSSEIKEIAEVFDKNNFRLYLVGGAVRDQLLKKTASDFDFTTDATPDEVKAMFKTVIPVGIEHGTVAVIYKGSEYQITTFRTDGKYSDNRRPDCVQFVRTIEDDLRRRDFTINAFAWNIKEKKLVDLFNGKADLKSKTIRAIGNPVDRFTEDALRMMRACRFAATLNFTIEDETLSAISEMSDNINNISIERIKDEFVKMLGSVKPSIGIEYLRTTGLLKHILPELNECYGIEQNKFHKYDVYYHNLYSCDAAPRDNLIVRIAALFHDIAKPQTRREVEQNENSFYNHEIIGSYITNRVMKRMKFSNEERKHAVHLVKHHMFYYTDEWSDGAVRRFLRNVGVENLPDLFTLRDADRNGNGSKTGIPRTFLQFKDKISEIIDKDSALKVTDLDIDGNIVMTCLNIKPGPIIGEILNYLLELVLDEPSINTRETLIEKAAEYYEKKTKYASDNFGNTPDKLGKF